MNSIFEFQGDMYAADALAAVVVYAPDEDEEEGRWSINLVLRNSAECVNYFADTEREARAMQLQAVTAWKNALV